MITITETKELFTFDELSEESREHAINECISAWMECEPLVPEEAIESYHKAWEKAEQMQTPWFWGNYVWDYCEKFILKECDLAYYLEDGEFYRWISGIDDDNQIQV